MPSSAPAAIPSSRNESAAVRSNSGLPGERPAYRRVSDGSVGPGRRFRRTGVSPVSVPPPSCPDLFRASTSCGIAVRAGHGRGGGGTWMPGTSPGMTIGRERSARLARHCPRPSAHRPARKSKPDSSGLVPGMTTDGAAAPGSAGRGGSPRPASGRPKIRYANSTFVIKSGSRIPIPASPKRPPQPEMPADRVVSSGPTPPARRPASRVRSTI